MADDEARLPQKSSTHPESKYETSKINYTATGYGNDHGSLHFGRIDRNAEVTAGVQLQAADARHQVSLDNDGKRKGYTTISAPANFSLLCANDKTLVDEAKDTLSIISENGNILINAGNGKIRLQGTDIELYAVGEGGAKGNIKINATESIVCDSKKFLVSTSILYRISSTLGGEISACGPLIVYGSVIRGVTASVFHKDSKVGGQFIQQLNNVLTAVSIFRKNSSN